MATLSKGYTFGATEQVTNTKLHNLVDNATITSIATADLANLAVTTAKIAANAVDGTKIAMGSDAQGDTYHYDGTDVVRLAAGTSGQYLQTKGSAADPVWATAFNVKVGSETRDISLTTNQAFTGVGFTPKAVIFMVNPPNDFEVSIGVDDGTTAGCVFTQEQISAGTWDVSANSIQVEKGASTRAVAVITTLDADGFTLDWTKTGSPTGTVTIKYLALG